MLFLHRQTETYPLETTKQRCRRYLSLAIIMFSMMVSSIGKSSCCQGGNQLSDEGPWGRC